MKFLKWFSYAAFNILILVLVFAAVYNIFPLKYASEIRTYSAQTGVDRYLVAALIKAESNYNPYAESYANAKGVMQLTEETARFCAERLGIDFKDEDIYDPSVNIRLGVYYLKRMTDIFKDEDMAVAAYNAGEGRVSRWLSDPTISKDGKTLDYIPFKETDNHVKKIKKYKKIYKMLYPNL